MSGEKFDQRAHLGPLVEQVYISDLCAFDERVWTEYRAHADQQNPIAPGSHLYLVIRMMYIAELTSNAIRMNATWELTPPAMSLVRDRYEQTVRFSWLMRNPDQDALHQYERYMFAKIRNVIRDVGPKTITRFKEAGHPLPQWATESLTKEEREYLEAWDKLDLRSMASQRDNFATLADNHISKQKLEPWYNAVYRQFSSVAHYDRFAVEMAYPRPLQGDKVAMSLQPHWPKLLILYTAFLDTIQCHEATHVCFEQNTSIKFESLFLEYISFAAKFEE